MLIMHNFKIEFNFVKHFKNQPIFWLYLMKIRQKRYHFKKNRLLHKTTQAGLDTQRFDKKK